ncbi:hypothetical protein CLE01_34350 [Cryobacterium levicorallinum]|nr:hypothetical protein CLE01_34350 [Cryobacterium levicorallinum]
MFYFTAPSVFPIVFGAQWEEAGYISQALVPWLFMVTFTSPVANVFVVTGQQEWALAFAALSTFISLGFLALTPLDLLPAVTWLAFIMAALLLLWVGMALFVARSYDRSGKIEKDEV